jgi:hypothetical protein
LVLIELIFKVFPIVHGFHHREHLIIGRGKYYVSLKSFLGIMFFYNERIVMFPNLLSPVSISPYIVLLSICLSQTTPFLYDEYFIYMNFLMP